MLVRQCSMPRGGWTLACGRHAGLVPSLLSFWLRHPSPRACGGRLASRDSCMAKRGSDSSDRVQRNASSDCMVRACFLSQPNLSPPLKSGGRGARQVMVMQKLAVSDTSFPRPPLDEIREMHGKNAQVSTRSSQFITVPVPAEPKRLIGFCCNASR